MISFKDWFNQHESSAFTRARREAALGLRPPMADFASRSTPSPFEFKSLTKKLKKKKETPGKKVNAEIDKWLNSAESLKKDLYALALAIKNRKIKDKEIEKEDSKKPKVDSKEDKLKDSKPDDKNDKSKDSKDTQKALRTDTKKTDKSKDSKKETEEVESDE